MLEDGVGNRPHQLANLLRCEHGTVVRVDGSGSDGLVHDAERVAHRPVAGLGQQRQRGVFGFNTFLRGNHLELRKDVVELYRMKAEVLAARADGLRNVLRLGSRHHEDDVRRRLFECLQQSIERSLGDLVRFVEDVNLVAVACGRVAGRVAQFANLVDAAVGGGVDLDYIHGVALADLNAGVAHAAGLRRGTLGRAYLSTAIQGLGKDAGDGGFANAAVAGKDIAVGDAVLRERVQQCTCDVVLAGYVGKALRTIFASQYLVTHAINNSLGPILSVRAPGAIVSFRGDVRRGGKCRRKGPSK